MLVAESNTEFGSNARLLGGSQGHLLMVASGLGTRAESSGAAAEVAVDVMARQFVDVVPTFFGLDYENELKAQHESAVASSHRAVREASSQLADQVMGATLTAAHVLWPRMYLVHLGDCRCYLIRGSEVRQLTTDHVRRLPARIPLGDGGDRPGERESSALLTNALGAGIERPSVEFSKVDLDDEDTIVLCTASLVEGLGDERKLGDAAGLAPAGRSADALIEAVSESRASRDATVVVARFPTTAPDSRLATSRGPPRRSRS